jgi:F-type H+-transporting ATPase subunit epsilon
MGDSIRLEIVTPRGRTLAANVDEVTAPSVEGEFGVLPGHLPLLAALRTGIVSYRQGSETKRCAVGSGFAEAGPDKLIILTTEFAEPERVDPVLVRRDLAEVQGQLSKIEGVPIAAADARGVDPAAVGARERRDELIAKENWLAAQLELLGDPLPATQRPHEEFGPPTTPEDEDDSVGGDRSVESDPSRRQTP